MTRTADSASAVVLIDLQNDFLSPDGAYGRAGVTSAQLAALPARLAPVLQAARAAGIPIISTQFTLMPVRGRPPLISSHLLERRPFLGTGDFTPGSRGHALVDSLAPADVVVHKIAYSAFHGSPLEHVLRSLGIDTLILAGILTNGGVASTARAAHVLGYDTCVLSDGCADLRPELHELGLQSLGAGVAQLATCAETVTRLAAA
jgi:ureidoacrylate peracid hydrolase